jgi:hypothetical protein
MRKNLAWSALTLLVIVFVVCDIVFVTTRRMRGDAAGGFALGVLFAQVTLLAVWTAWFPVHDLIRVPLGTVGAALVSWVAAARSGNPREAFWFGGAAFLQWFAIQLSLTCMRRIFGWRLVRPGEYSTVHKEIPFGLRELFAWIALFASALSITLTVLRDDSQYQLRQILIGGMPRVMLLAAIGSFFAWSAIWGAFVPNGLPFWMLAAACCCVGLCGVAEGMVFRAIFGRGVYDELFFWTRAFQFTASTIGLLLIRACGFRLQRARGEGSND